MESIYHLKEVMKYVILLVLVIVAAGFVYRSNISNYLVAGKTGTEQKEKDKKGKNKKEKSVKDEGVNIVQKWELPDVLKEVSGIAYIDEARFACVQDEDGTIFIYNVKDQKIEKEIPFAGPGDYEGLTLNNNTAYVVRADGRLYEVPMSGGKSAVKEIVTPLTVDHNVEGLFYDKSANRLLIAIKDNEPGNKPYKGVYAFDLATNTFVNEPVFKLDLQNELFHASGKKKSEVKPSAIAIHPTTGEVYITDGPSARLLVMDAAGNPKKVYSLGNDFPQAEGITFSPSGELFISNEGKQRGNIIQTEIQ
jgi:uncharacterized protein YjiK